MSVQLSHPYIKIDRIEVLYSFSLIGKLKLLSQMVASLVIADMAQLIPALTSVAALPSLLGAAPRYLNVGATLSSQKCPPFRLVARYPPTQGVAGYA